MSELYVIASIFWGAAAVNLAAWYLFRAIRARSLRNLAERRSFPRPKLGFRASLTLQMGDGTSTALAVRGYNLTKFGAKVVSKYPLPPGTVVCVDLPDYHLMGVGHVLHCAPHRLKHCIGMEFKSPLMRSQAGAWAVQVVSQA